MWNEHYNQGIYFTVSKRIDLLNGKKLSDEQAKAILSERKIDLSKAEALVKAIKPAWFPDGAAIDLEFLLHQLTRNNVTDYSTPSFQNFADLARIKLQGTDGIRSRTRDEEVSYTIALEKFIAEGVIYPAFFGLSAKALGKELLEHKLVTTSDTVVMGGDGRDLSGNFGAAVARGFNELGFKVYDAGVLATPGVPIYAYYTQSKIGTIVTASHNPSNQNGIKYTFNHLKLLCDGPAGEFGLTANMYRIADYDEDKSYIKNVEDASKAANNLLDKINIQFAGFAPGELSDIRFVYDGANGAYSLGAKRVLDALKLDYVAINVEPKGHNINQNGGVGEIEGIHWFEGKVSDDVFKGYLPTIQLMFNEGRKESAKPVYGLVNDGDGDRGYLLVYGKSDDRVYVVPGDEVATWVVLGRKAEGTVTPQSVFVTSVESDIMAGYNAINELGMQNETACVGDKYLVTPVREGRDHIVGCEESGHVNFGVTVTDKTGKEGKVYTGNGLVSVLYAMSVIHKQKPSIEKIVHPFPEGAKDIRYVYFADKARFFNGSEVWNSNKKTIIDTLEKGKPSGYTIKEVVFKDDLQMLYVAAFNPQGLKEGTIFVRNSGTEIKTGVAFRSTKALESLFYNAMLAVHRENQKIMKDMSNRDAQRELAALEKLKAGPVNKNDLKKAVESACKETIAQADFDALLYAMRKEKIISQMGDNIVFDEK